MSGKESAAMRACAHAFYLQASVVPTFKKKVRARATPIDLGAGRGGVLEPGFEYTANLTACVE